ncbi:GntR family transcriptional regulator [Leekyejoonella antrihumi]|uniref:GntR family transcriptional regulator n=1 Tax=Leekyejoonella antrihumi TaxID=1660198 RepID=UPI00164912C7|nr:GntR family transcriptional regulator [Leekyejoonella antrihumi]
MGDSDALLVDDLRPLRDQIRERVRAWIIDGRLEPGVPVRERELAERFGVSRLPVREAIRMLEVEGFVETRARRGAIVRGLHRRDVEQEFEVREVLEVLEARLAAKHLESAGARRLRWLVDESEHMLQTDDRARFAEVNAEFHDAISQAAGNHTLAAVLLPLAGRLQWNTAQNAHPERILAEHRRLADAIASNDPDRAGEEARVHLNSRRQALLGTLPDSESADSL